MKKILTFCTIIACFCASVAAQNGNFSTQNPSEPPLREMRAVWLTTIGGIDWPRTYAYSYETITLQKAELCRILDQLQQANINTILLQTRIRATTIYPSTLEPWDACLTGNAGKSPGYDPLAFAIEECHKRGMQLHAWMVAIPIGKWNGAGCRNLRNSCPNIVKKIGDEGFINPEASGAADYLAALCRDVVSRYDIDGIHLDYIRYPDQWKNIRNKQQARDNITRIVRSIHSDVKRLKPWVMISSSPVGKYADTRRASSHGWNARDIVCQDVAQWMNEGLMDAIFPMMYFRDNNFYPFAIDWQERSRGTIVIPGLGIYIMHPREGNWSLADITRELFVARQYGMGNCMFRSKFFTDDTKGIYSFYKSTFAPLPALRPAMSSFSYLRPSSPTALKVSFTTNGEASLKWDYDKPINLVSQHDSHDSYTFNVYGSDTYPVDTRKASNLLAADYHNNALTIPHPGHVVYYAVTATDRYGNESEAIQSYSRPGLPPARQGHKKGRTPLRVSDNRIILNSNDAPAGAHLIVSNMFGAKVMTLVANRYKDNTTCVNVSLLSAGHYQLHLLTKKKHKHHLGIFSIPPKAK